MLKLKYLFDNREKVKMILKNWEYDLSTIDEMLCGFRISSNYVYPFKKNDKVFYLRFSPNEENKDKKIRAELNYIDYLNRNNYPAPKVVKSKFNSNIVNQKTPWGNYTGVVFKEVVGVKLSDVDYTSEISRIHGKYLGRLHKLSSLYRPLKKMIWSYKDILDWIEKNLLENNANELVMNELNLIKEELDKIPKTTETFGVIHYDFEMDNIFYNSNDKSLQIIDFDDLMYNWYVVDILKTLENIKEETEEKLYEVLKLNFIKGYREEFNVSDEVIENSIWLQKFMNLYSYTRIFVSQSEKWNNEPEWMIGLRSKLEFVLEQKTKKFGKV